MNINLTLIGQSISFIFFVWFCLKFIWPPVINALEQRKKTIADGLAAGEKGHHELELAQKRSVELIKDGKEQAAEIINMAQKRHDEIVDEAKEDARTEGNRILTAARAEIDQERQQVREELRQQVALLAIAGAEQILMREVDRNVHKAALDKISADL
jgi:F-type H+-transporting ATPase subunit b